MKGFIGKKIGMTRMVDQETGKILPVTLLEIGEHVVTQIKNVDSDGYCAAQISTVPMKKETKTKKFTQIKEFACSDDCEMKKGDKYSLEALEEGASVRVTGTSKGKGFAGRIKRFNQSRGPLHPCEQK